MSETIQIVGFILGDGHYGLDIMGVEEIIRMLDITPVPRAPSFVEGIINLRGRIIPVVDLRKRLHITPAPHSGNTRVVVMKVDDRRLGFIVDKVEEVMDLPVSIIGEAPGVSLSAAQHYVEGVARTPKGMIILLDILKIFSPEEHQELQKLK
ncbi:MAG: chemotaxis protein CheW [Deferribacteraceae bacterium]|jgi:purine-binding chemotaxis protein CheW|nr:chemotaxis protein CheW [Deferribacteraceae bacterium]